MNSRTVFAIRNEAKELQGIEKVNKLNEGLRIATNLYQYDPNDEWNQNALAWTLIDLSKYYITIDNLNQATTYYNQLNAIEFYVLDDIIEGQTAYLKAQLDTDYKVIKKAEELSKNNKHKQAIAIIHKLIAEYRLKEIHHEAYGWIIYRYITKESENLTSTEVRTFLRDYMLLKNERPSLLHSMILSFALSYSKKHKDFNFYRFFELWAPENLREEDKSNQMYNGKEVSSLIERVFRGFIEGNYAIDVNYLITNVDLGPEFQVFGDSGEKVLDILRKPYFWMLYNANNDSKHKELWQLFDNYKKRIPSSRSSQWHSKILGLAEWYMKDEDEWRFLPFFENWNSLEFMVEDWKEQVNGEYTNKPLAIKCLNKAFNLIKAQDKETYDSGWLINLYNTATSKFPNNEWLQREKAILLIENKEYERAKKAYRSLALKLGDKSYIWNEFSSCFKTEKELIIGMLSKAIQLERDEDYLGDIRLKLAETLIEKGMHENAYVELNTYKKHRELKSWRLSETYSTLQAKVGNQSISIEDNRKLYIKYASIAEEYAYEEISWTELVLIDIWKDAKKRDRLKFSNGKDIEFSIRTKRFKSFKKTEIGNVFEFKVHKELRSQEKNKNNYKDPLEDYKYLPLLARKSSLPNWSILPDAVAIVEYINIDKNVIHAITSENEMIFFKDDLSKYSVNDFIIGKLIISKRDDQTRLDLKSIKIIDASDGVKHFPKVLAVVDNVNKQKKLFHFVANNIIHGIVRFNETELRPNEGDFLEVWYVKKVDIKRNREFYKPISVEETDKTDESLVKEITGLLELKYKADRYTVNYEDLDEYDKLTLDPDFGFISDYYVPKYILEKYDIGSNCRVIAKAVSNGQGKWNIISLKQVEN